MIGKSSEITYRRFFVNGFDEKLLVRETNVPYLTPWETDLRG